MSVDADSSDLTNKDLEGKEFIHSKTYEGIPSAGYSRSSVEMEETNTVQCVDGATMLKLLRSDRNGRTVLQRLRKSDSSAAFTAGYPLDEMTWDSDSHKLRERSAFVSLSIESGRYEVNPETGARELSLGTDIMDDMYYDTKDYKLLKRHMVLRGRARWDTPTQIRRLLVGAKFGIEVDSFGIKSSAKIDERNDGASDEQIASMDRDIRRGFKNWGSRDQPLGAVREVYERLAGKPTVLPNTSKYIDVLLLEQKANLRGTRARFHLNETNISSVQGILSNGNARLDAALGKIAMERSNGFGANQATVAAFEAKVKAVRDGSLLSQRANAAVKKIDGAQDTSPAAMLTLLAASQTTPLLSDTQRVVAETQSALYHELATDLDGIRRFITRAEDRTFEDEPKLVMAWMKSADLPALGTTKSNMARLNTYDAFATAFDRFVALPDAQRAELLTAYNTFGKAQQAAGESDFKAFAPRVDANLKPIGAQVACEAVRVHQRMIEEAGTAHVSLWFDRARQLFVPGSYRVTSNFMIDSMDMTEMYEHSVWDTIPEAERTADKTLPADKSLHTMLSNDVQIELGMEKPYMDRLQALAALPKSPENDRLIIGAKLIFDTYQASMHLAGLAKGDKVISELKKAGGPACMAWGPVDMSKGETALSMIKKAQSAPK